MPSIKSLTDIINDIKIDLLVYGSKFSDLRQGSRIAAIIKAISASLANTWIGIAEWQSTFFISTASGTDLKARAGDLGMTFDEGTQATGSVIAFATSPYTVPLGTLLKTADNLVIMEVITATNIISPHVSMPVIVSQVGSIGNLAAGTVLTTIDGSLGNVVFKVGSTGLDENGNPTGPLTGGSNAESDSAIRSRFPIYLKNLPKSTYPAVLQALQGVAGITSMVVENHVPIPGWITISLSDGSDSISDSLRAAIAAVILANAPAGMGYLLRIITKRNIGVTATVYSKDTSKSPAVIQAEVTAAFNTFSNSLILGQDINIGDLYRAGYLTTLDSFVLTSPTTPTVAAAGELLGINSINITVVYV